MRRGSLVFVAAADGRRKGELACRPIMKKFALALVTAPALFIANPLAAEPAATPEPTAIAHAREIVETIMPPDHQSTVMAEMTRAMTYQMRSAMADQFTDAGLRQIVDAHLTKVIERIDPVTQRYLPVLMEAMIQAYAREFSVAELIEVSRFAKTPAGRHYFSRSTALMADPAVAAANRTYFAEAQAASLASQNDLRAAIMAYLQKHPEVARKMAEQAKAGVPQP